MIDIGQITALIGGINGSIEIVKAVQGVKDSVEANDAVLKLQGDLITLQGKVFILHELHSQTLQENSDLKDKVREFEDWATQAENYELRDFGGHTFAYALKTEVDTAEPDHYLCATCYQERKKSILQFSFQTNSGQDKYHCNICGNSTLLGHRRR